MSLHPELGPKFNITIYYGFADGRGAGHAGGLHPSRSRTEKGEFPQEWGCVESYRVNGGETGGREAKGKPVCVEEACTYSG